MQVIHKAKEIMTSKERTRKTFCHEKTDRVTIGYEANDTIHKKFAKALGIKNGDMELVRQVLGVDYRGVPMVYNGKPLFDEIEDRIVHPLDGCRSRWISNSSGGYWDFCDFPLKDATDDEFYNFPVPNPDDFDYELAFDYCKSQTYYGVHLGNPSMPDIINSNGRIMGVEDILCHLVLENKAALDFIKKRADMYFGVFERILEKCKNHIDFMWIGEDLGTQIAPLISLETFRKQIRPIQQKFVDLAKVYNVPVMVHTCGSSSWVYEDFIEMGIAGVDTLQPEAVNMSPQYLVEHFGGRLCFRGCISTAGPLTYGTPVETDQICRETLDILMSCRGYHFAATHYIQDNSPVENVIAMYNAAHKYGVYQ